MDRKLAAALKTYDSLVETLGEDHPTTRNALVKVIDVAPPHIKAMISAKAREMGLIPEPAGCLPDGTKLYRLEDVAMKMGMTPEEAAASVDEFLAANPAAGGSIDPAQIHRLH